MKIKFSFISVLILLIVYTNGFSDSKDATNDMFGLEMKVIAPFPDIKDDGIDMDTVRYGHIISVEIKYKNLTDVTQRDFEISAFFPNRFESYTTLISWNRRPDYADHPDSSIQATWKFGNLAPSDSGKIEFSLVASRAPKDTIYLTYEVVARASWTPVSQISHTNIYVSGGGIAPYPNLFIDKIDNRSEVFPGDTITYTIRYGNIGEIGSFPAKGVAIFDTLPAYLNLITNQYSPPIDSLPDGRYLLIWDIAHIVPYSFNDSIQFKVKVDLIADRDSLIYNSGLITSSNGELELTNNKDREPVLVKPKIDLAVAQEGIDQYKLFRDDSQNFSLKCKNLSSLDLDNINFIVNIDDGIAGDNIYSLQNIGNSGQVQTGETAIHWIIPHLAAQDSMNISLSIILNNVNRAENYTINFSAAIDSVVQLADGNHSDINTSNNHDSWLVQVDATPDLAIKIIPDKDSTYAKETSNFKLICSNSSISATDSIGVRAYIDDTVLNSNIYSVSVNADNGATNVDTTLISWKIPPLNKDESKELNFALTFNQIKQPYRDYPDFKIIATIDSVEIDSTELLDNESSTKIFVDGTPNLAISIRENNNLTVTTPNSTLHFTITCNNLSSLVFDSVNVKSIFDGQNIYSIVGVTGGQFLNNILKWKIPPLAHRESYDKNFDMLIDKIAIANNYQIKFIASVDTLEIDPREFLNNVANWQITVNAMPIVKLGPISIQPGQPHLRDIIEYTIPYSNDGNFPAKNSVMTIDKPDYTFMLYYIRNDQKTNLADMTVSSLQIPLGDIVPKFSENIIAGLQIYSYKQLPENVSSPLKLTVKSRINFDSGEVSASRSDDVRYDVVNSDLILDKNIVEPDKLPLKITFKSSDFGNVDLKIYNLAGEFIKTIYIGPVEKGDIYNYYWDGLNEQGSAVSSGVYFVYAVSKFYNGYKKTIIVK